MSEETRDISRWRKLRFTPMRDWLRGRLTGRLDWQTRVDEAALPAPAKELVRRVVKKTRLWRLEKADVADELIAHFADGMEACTDGRDARPTDARAADAPADFGDEKQAARLIRRAKKRNRPWIWKAMVRTLQAVGVVFVLYLAAIGWFALGKPDISVNYLAKLNAPARAVPEGQRAWPIYRDALLYYGLRDMAQDPAPLFVGSRLVRPTDAQWPRAVAFLKKHAHLLDLIRKGASKPGLGLVSHFSPWSYAERDRRALYTPDHFKLRPDEIPKLSTTWKTHSVIGVLLPQLGILRKMAWLMAAEMQLAETQDDADRAMADFNAILGLADQARETPNLISELVADSITTLGFKSLADTLADDSTLFNSKQLVYLAHRLASLDELVDLRLGDESYFIFDTFQRLYDKSGHITDEGMRLLPRLGYGDSRPYNNEFHLQLSSVPPVALLPLTRWLIADRSEMIQQLQRLMAMSEACVRRPLWEELRSGSGVGKTVKQWGESPLLSIRYRPLMMLYPATDVAARSMHRKVAVRDALEVAIALELYRREHHGAYPRDLSVLVPRYLPRPPVDYSTGKPLLYKVVDGQPLLYGRGLDGDDDGGTAGSEQLMYGGQWAPVPKEDDWVLFPKPRAKGSGSD